MVSADQVVELVNQTSEIELKPWFVRKVMRKELHMSYRRLK